MGGTDLRQGVAGMAISPTPKSPSFPRSITLTHNL